MLWLLFLNLFFNLSSQTQLFREFAGLTVQNLQAQASQWTLSDLSGIQYSPTISDCIDDKIVLKPASLPSGTTFKKTFGNLEDHNVIRFFVKMYYMGDYTSQTVDIKFDGITLGTSKVLPLKFPAEFFSCSSLTFGGNILYYGTIPHSDPSVTVEFSSNLHDSDLEINWGLRDFSLVTDLLDTPLPSPTIYTQSFLSDFTGTSYPCFVGYYPDDTGDCFSCTMPCANCFGADPDQCFAYLYDSPEMRLCPTGQTFTTSGCIPCTVENCTYCDKDVNKCDTCLTTCAQCDNNGESPQCQECTVESNLVLYEGSCIETCPEGTYQDSDRKCQLCQAGCLQCTSPEQCVQCDTSETHLLNDLCICNQAGEFFERDTAKCTGTCLLGCGNCLNSEECLLCYPGLIEQPNGDCRCFQDGFYYQDETGLCTGQCLDYCNYCHDETSCIECSGNRVPKDGMCKCESPRILIGNSCECPAYMIENSDTSNCEYIDLIDIAYQSTVSPLFDAILQVQMNPLKRWTSPVLITWMVDCTFQNSDTRDQFQTYMLMQNTDVLLIPSSFLEYSFQCAVYAGYTGANGMEISKALIFETLSSSQPQVHIVGGPFQIFDYTELNFIFAEVKSSTGQVLSSSDVQIKWTQTEGDKLNMNSVFTSSNPFQLKFTKCTLSKGKIYKFNISVTMKSNKQTTSQEVTIGVYSPKIQTQITGITDNYQLSSKSLTLQAQLFIEQDNECNQKAQLSDLIDQSTAMYIWECFILDLELPSTRRLLLDETPQITDDPNIIVHSDPLKLFYHSTSSPTITIPSSYFTLYTGYQLIFYLTVTDQSKDPIPSIAKFNIQQPSLYNPKNHTSVRIVTSKPSIPTPSLTCISENNCQAYSDDFPTKFISNSPYNSQYSYNYLLNTFSAFQVKTPYTTFLTITSISPPWGTKIVPQILYTISDGGGTNIASAFFVLPWNNPPQSGFLNVYPTEGEAYNTKFFLTTSNWIDVDLPVSYEFYTTYDRDRNMMMKTFNPYDETILLPQPYYAYCYVGVLVKDNLKSISQQSVFVPLTGEAQSLCDAIDKSSQVFNASKSSPNLFQRFRLLQMIIENLNRWEWFDYQSPCNITEAEFKFTAITEMKDLFLSLGSKEELRLLLLNSLNLATDPLWNQDNNWILYMSILDSYYQAASSTSILPPGEYNLLFTILDNLINYMKKPETSIEDPPKVFVYINTLLRSTLSQVLPTDPSVAYYGTFYSYFTVKTTYCKVLQELQFLPYGRFGLEANVTLRPNQQIPPKKCNNEIDMIFMAFRPNYTITGETYEAQTLIYFDLRDSKTGESLFDIFTFILISPIQICPDGGSCNPGGGGEGTEIYGIFDLKDQVNKIFAKSNIAQIQNISVLGKFDFWKSVAFWTVITFSAWFLVSFYWLYVKHPTYCVLKANTNINKQSLFKRINFFFWVAHPLVGIYLYNDPKIAKSTKLAIYYQRLVIVMVFSTIFSSIEQGEGAIFKAYIVLFNALTVTPTNAILSRTFQWALNNKTKSSKTKLTSKIKLLLGILFYFSLLIGCFIIMFIIEAQQDASQNKTWALNFIIAFGQDLSLSPFISLFNKVSFFKLSQTGRFIRLIKSQRIIGFFLPRNFRSIYQSIFVNITVTTTIDDLPSPRTTTMSPLSTDRKLLRFSTADLQSSASPRIHSPYEFRSRRASETEINTVDFVATEALVSNRFQTFFSEAKPENVKEFSPIIKENFTKMQSSNLYSSTSTNTKLQQSLAGNQKSLLLKLERFKTKPMASIVFHPETEPAEIYPEEIFSFGENTETMYASQPKLWKNGKTMESSIHKKTKKSKKNVSNRCETVI